MDVAMYINYMIMMIISLKLNNVTYKCRIQRLSARRKATLPRQRQTAAAVPTVAVAAPMAAAILRTVNPTVLTTGG